MNGIICLDAYNGRTMWTYELPGNLADFQRNSPRCRSWRGGPQLLPLAMTLFFSKHADPLFRIDLRSGELLGEFKTPAAVDQSNVNWGFLAYSDGLLFGFGCR